MEREVLLLSAFRLKLMKMPSKTKKEEQSSGEQKLEGKQILLVEDNEINMEIAEFYLKELGIGVDKAWNGQEAIDKFEESAPGTYDLILMDIMMPVMGGREAAVVYGHWSDRMQKRCVYMP